MILVIDNYDSFVHNLARYVRLCGFDTLIVRNDDIEVEECLKRRFDGVVISPGPKGPNEAGISMALIEALPKDMPLLGVCLGHQCLVQAFGGEVMRAQRPLHGVASAIRHDGRGLFDGITSLTQVGRYHSLIGAPLEGGDLEPTAWSEEGEVMAVEHRTRPWFGVQFHPESLLTEEGLRIMDNFLQFCKRRQDP